MQASRGGTALWASPMPPLEGAVAHRSHTPPGIWLQPDGGLIDRPSGMPIRPGAHPTMAYILRHASAWRCQAPPFLYLHTHTHTRAHTHTHSTCARILQPVAHMRGREFTRTQTHSRYAAQQLCILLRWRLLAGPCCCHCSCHRRGCCPRLPSFATFGQVHALGIQLRCQRPLFRCLLQHHALRAHTHTSNLGPW